MLGLHYPLPCEGGGGAHLNNNFSEFFPFRYKLFLIIEMDGKTAEAIGEKYVFDTVPASKFGGVEVWGRQNFGASKFEGRRNLGASKFGGVEV